MEIKLRPYQEDAIESFKKNNWTGLFEMATGTGKTITSLFASKYFQEEEGSIARLILVPFLHLSSQWIDEIDKLGMKGTIECNSNNPSWPAQLSRAVNNYNIGLTDEINIVVTYQSLMNENLLLILNRINKNIFLIADEAHYLGAPNIDISRISFIKYRLGLSATPYRWWDEEGTNKILYYFDSIVFDYDLEKAIRNDFLTNYNYYPIIIDLTPEEMDNYKELTDKIARLLSDERSDRELIEILLLKRKLIINNAEGKLEKLEELVKERNIRNTLFYCSPQNLDKVNKILAKRGIKSKRFFYKVKNKDRTEILKSFSRNDLQSLTAIKCLDEGVDVPSVQNAYFLTSTSNPREFVQRRGRILRKYPGKSLSNIYDFIVLPLVKNGYSESIIAAEMPRFAEFSRYAINREEANIMIEPYLKIYGLEELIYKLPWEVYEEMKEKYGNG